MLLIIRNFKTSHNFPDISNDFSQTVAICDTKFLCESFRDRANSGSAKRRQSAPHSVGHRPGLVGLPLEWPVIGWLWCPERAEIDSVSRVTRGYAGAQHGPRLATHAFSCLVERAGFPRPEKSPGTEGAREKRESYQGSRRTYDDTFFQDPTRFRITFVRRFGARVLKSRIGDLSFTRYL